MSPFEVHQQVLFTFTLIWVLCFLSLPKSISTIGIDYVCESNEKRFDTISCSYDGTLIITRDNNFYEGDCNDFPFTVKPLPRTILKSKTLVLASVMDYDKRFYFFQNESVIIADGDRRHVKPIPTIFPGFKGSITGALAIEPGFTKPDGKELKFTITLYTEKTIFFFHDVKIMKEVGLPIWTRTELYDTMDTNFPNLHRISPQITHILGTSGKTIKVLIASKDLNGIYVTVPVQVCLREFYRLNLTECIKETTADVTRIPIDSQLVGCNSFASSSGSNLLIFMLWGCSFIIFIAILGLIKCCILWIYKKTLSSRHKQVGFSVNSNLKGDPKRSHVLVNPARIQSYAFDSIDDHQSAVSINESYKDINYASDVAEDEKFC